MAEHSHRYVLDQLPEPETHVILGRCECGDVREYPANYDLLQAVSNKRSAYHLPGHYAALTGANKKRSHKKKES